MYREVVCSPLGGKTLSHITDEVETQLELGAPSLYPLLTGPPKDLEGGGGRFGGPVWAPLGWRRHIAAGGGGGRADARKNLELMSQPASHTEITRIIYARVGTKQTCTLSLAGC